MVASVQQYPICSLKNPICCGLQGFANGFCKGRAPVPEGRGWGRAHSLENHRPK